MNTSSDKNKLTPDETDNLKFSDLFNLEDIQHLQDTFADANGVSSLITLPDGTPITNPSNFCKLCSLVRETEQGRANCFKSDAAIGRQNLSGPIVHSCLSSGLWDAGASITVGGKHIANWLVGQVRTEEVDEQKVIAYADEIGANKEAIKKALNEVPKMSSDQFNKVSKMLFAFAKELSEKGYHIFQLKKQIAERERDNKQLISNEEKFRKLVADMHVGVLLQGPKAEILLSNPMALEMLGLSEDQLMGKTSFDPYWNVIREDGSPFPSTEHPVPQAITSGQQVRNVVMGVFRPAVNDRIWLLVDAIPQLDDDTNTKVQQVICTFIDITDRKMAEEILRQSAEKYRIAISASRMGTWDWDILTGRLTWSDTCKTMFGIPLDIDMKYEHFLNALVPEDREQANEQTWVSLNEKADYANEYRVQWIDGSIHWINALGCGFYNKEGEPIRMTGVALDITERKKAEEELRVNKEKFSKIFDLAPALISIIDIKTGKYIDVNDYAINFSGYSREETIGKTSTSSGWISEENRRLLLDNLDTNGKIIGLELSFTTKQGEKVYGIVNGEIIIIDNKENLLTLTTDITERKLMELQLHDKNEEYQQLNEELLQTNEELYKAKEKAEESDSLKTAFLQNMSHEIRTPMNAIMGFSDLLVDNYNNKPKLEKFSEIIRQRCSDLLDIINDLLDIARIESGQLAIHIEECNLSELFSELTTFFTEHQKRIDKKHIKFRLHAQCSALENVILVDKLKLKQIFINLIGNAFKFTDQGQIIGGCRMTNDQKLIFYVSDTGIGISADKHSAVFERFTQLNQKSTRLYGGTGLGLSIVKGLIDLLDGNIWLDSEPEKGTTFYFTMPYKTALISTFSPIITDKTFKFDYTNQTILVVEDDVFNTAYIKEILYGTGLKIIHTEYGKEAIQLAMSSNPDIVLMDIRLPDMDGYEATRQIKLLKPDLKIIAQTAYAANDDKHRAFAAGCVDYISKPLKKELLLQMIHKHIAKYP